MSFEIRIVAGAAMTEAAIKCPASIPIPTQAANTPPAVVANPPIMMHIISESVIDPM